jgi:hypothetical protein
MFLKRDLTLKKNNININNNNNISLNDDIK